MHLKGKFCGGYLFLHKVARLNLKLEHFVRTFNIICMLIIYGS